ncbi:DNA adenine methylase [Enterobacter cloacae complex sp. P6RS]|uniref:DNA adenine methylase n=1 Tax=Enterobacter TaxID=547 RepID=UPI0018761E14|nr:MULTISPECIES: DNA adenine methylase [Enterobacter]MBE4916768.1 DNA adenine methylase [Enterobacter cloacae complex sp. P4RS]MBE4994380.1 DNA adenine methylase [Enterobacter cloacae complex sp. P6RS]MCM7685089.1 DNA adenine methylase [Enterobacter bugandensis]
MSATPSPLRYPGGKTGIQGMVSAIIRSNDINGGHYAEPYAGGCGLALSLMFNQHIHEIHLNDLDRSIWAFWYSILNNTQDFIEKINDTDVTIDEWYRQRELQNDKNKCDVFNLGFSTFFLNRTNRSGIILKAGVIGGFEQKGKYALDCRFNKKKLIDKIKRINKYKHRIHVYNMDAIDFIKTMDVFLPEKSMFCIDPPYFDKGSFLYTNFYNAEDHKTVYEAISEIKHPWILTYDNAKEIREIYAEYSQYLYTLNYSAAEKKVGTELLIAANDIFIPKSLALEKCNNASSIAENIY